VSIRCSSVTRCSRCSGDNSPSWTPRLPREVVPHPGADRAPWEHGRRGAPAQGLARCAPRPRRESWTPSAHRTTSVSSPCTAAQPEDRAPPATSTSA
jgi:hypothetical protein